MKIINVETLTVAQNGVYELALTKNQPGDTVVSEVYFDTTAAFTLQGTVDGTTWRSLKVVNMGTLEKADSAAANGYYMVPGSGLKALKLTAGGAGTVVVKKNY